MSYHADPASRLRAVLAYAAILFVGGVSRMLVRTGVITGHLLW